MIFWLSMCRALIWRQCALPSLHKYGDLTKYVSGWRAERWSEHISNLTLCTCRGLSKYISHSKQPRVSFMPACLVNDLWSEEGFFHHRLQLHPQPACISISASLHKLHPSLVVESWNQLEIFQMQHRSTSISSSVFSYGLNYVKHIKTIQNIFIFYIYIF